MAEFKPKLLRQDTPREAIRWLPKKLDAQKGVALVMPYVEAPYVMRVLDEACGPDGWDFDIPMQGETWAKGILQIFTPERTLRYTNFGYSGRPGDTEPLKSAATDALKRCAYLAGIGRDLREEFDPIIVKAEIHSRNGKTYLRKLVDDPWEVWRKRKGEEETQGVTPREVSRKQIFALAKTLWPEESLDQFRAWLAEEDEHPGWTYATEKHIPPDKYTAVYEALEERQARLSEEPPE